jgi:hypothetical protein
VTRERKKLALGKGAAFIKGRLKRLPQEDETWEADLRVLPKPLSENETHYLGLVVVQGEGSVLAEEQVEHTPDVNDLATLLAHAMRRPLAGRGHRPKRVRVRKNPRWPELFPHLQEVGVEVFPAVAQWVRDGHIEVGDQEGFGFVARALDCGGLAFEDDRPRTLAEALAALEKGLREWFEEQGVEVEDS